MKKAGERNRLVRWVAWLLVFVFVLGLIPHVTLPVLSLEQEALVYLDGEEIRETVLKTSDKLRFEARFDGEAEGYSWQILDQKSERWINIADGYTGFLWVTYALVGSMLKDDAAYLRCCVFTAAGEVVTEPVKVTLSHSVEEDVIPYGENEAAVPTAYMMRTSRSTEPELQIHSIVINYLFDNNTVAFEPWGATVEHGKPFHREEPVKSPTVVGYEPFRRDGEAYVPADEIALDFDTVTENIIINVIYEPKLVEYKVHHHFQNVENDEYSTEFETTTGMALTGSTVGDGLQLTKEERPGFNALEYERLKVAADGSTVIEIRYDRNYYLIDFDMAGGYGTEPVYTRYGATVGANDPIRHGYVFGGWELTTYDGRTPTTAETSRHALTAGGTVTVPAASLSYKALWITQDTTYTLVFWRENAEDNGYTYWGYLPDQSAKSGTLVSGRDAVREVSGIDDEKYFTFNEARTDKDVLVEGDGSTVVNVYYTRNFYTLSFMASGDCIIEEDHSHSAACYDDICGKGHTHDENCRSVLICEIEEHASHGAECLICRLPEHIHGSVGCECTLEEHRHVAACWSEAGSAQVNVSGAPASPQEGQVYRTGWFLSYTYYIYIGGAWHKYNGRAGSGTIVPPDCGKTSHSHGTDCDCTEEPHAHSEGCYSDSLHSHGTECYEYSCGAQMHVHTEICYRLHCGIPEGHSHSSDSRSSKVVKSVYKKYRASLKNVFPVTDDHGVTYDSGERWDPVNSALYDQVLVYIDEMPGEDLTLAVDTSSQNTYYMYYYLECLPGETGDVTYGGAEYKEYKEILANYGKVTRAEDFFPIPGFVQYASDPAFSSDSITISRDPRIVNFYYKRITDHKVEFNSNGIVLTDKTRVGLPYGAKVEELNFVPSYPANLEPNAYTFGGWYTSPGCFDGTEMDWENTTMPEGDLLLYAKWEPVKHTVRVFLEKNQNQQLGQTQTVAHGAFAEQPHGNVSNGNYVFLGWFYEDTVDGETVEKAFVFNGIPVLQDMDIYARWGSHFSVNYTVYYKLREDGREIEIAPPTMGSAIVGNNRTFAAKTEGELYEGYREGFYPEVKSHTITMSAEGNHEFTFYYRYVEAVPYKVQYLSRVTGDSVCPDKVVSDNRLSVATENFSRVDEMMPDAYQKRLVLSASPENADPSLFDENGIYFENVITFYYSEDKVHAYYRVVHHVQNMHHEETYREFSSEENVGVIGENFSASAMTLTGFSFNGAKTKVDGALWKNTDSTVSIPLSENGALVEFFYDREDFRYLVRYLTADGTLLGSKEGQDAFGLQIIEYAPDLTASGYSLFSENAKTLTISANEALNVIDFYYQEKNVSVKYQIVGPEGCGTLSQASENLTAISGTVLGSKPQVQEGHIFRGWFLDEDCTLPVSESWVGGDGHLTPQKSGEVWTDTVYYAKFVSSTTDLTIRTISTATADADQLFIFRIQGKADTETAEIDLTVTVAGNGSVTVTELPLGFYTATELCDWSWRYENDTAVREFELKYNNGSNELEYDNRRENGYLLDGNAAKDNRY